MGKTIVLKQRKIWDNTITLGLPYLERVFNLESEAEAKDKLWEMMGRVRESILSGAIEGSVHDIVWFREIVTWKPKSEGVKPKDRAPWVALSKLLNEIGEPELGEEIGIVLTDYQARLIGDRLTGGAFEFHNVSVAQDEFVDDLMAALDRKFDIAEHDESKRPPVVNRSAKSISQVSQESISDN